jgi:UDPglucose 6-dehydrogenase
MTVSVLGLAYKPDTNVVEESQGLALARSLVGNGNKVIVFDPLAMENARNVLKGDVQYARSLRECLEQADCVVIANPCKEFRALEPDDFPRRRGPVIVFDCWRVLQEKLKHCEWINYIPLGKGKDESQLVLRLSTMWRQS